MNLLSILKKYKTAILLVFSGICLSGLLVTRCSTKQQNEAVITDAVASEHLDYLQAENESLKLQITGYKTAQDSLRINIASLNKELVQKELQRAEIASKYAAEKARLRKLPNDSAVGYFLDRADCGECPIVKYDSSYLVEIDPIRFYNDLAVGFDEQVAVNANLRRESEVKSMVIKDLSSVNNMKDREIEILNKIIVNDSLTGSYKDIQITAGEKMYKAEKLKHTVTKIVAGAVIVIEAVTIVVVTLK